MRQFILEEVKEALDRWRTTKKSKSQPIPDEIWQKIKSLKNNYTKKQIISALKINYSQYKMKIEDVISSTAESPPQFASIIMDDMLQKQTSQIIVKRQDGLTLTINDFNNDHLISLISMFKNN
jgi:hypothetical protein